ncbi:LysR family transcriptional regulator [Fangia hongkongensis]|uniref:LysR family transcriptional regulator n=1 Tax=Fangia hongkongensis TaxID=270495 RepID=UPI00036F51EC|nr:LysR family transcriptional regulator [Fangia hongkongensis]MBK2125328.1 LysR family transcriptional regulator [Fangia hongkongensis]
MNNIYWRGVYAFIHVAEERSFTRAAEKLGASKSNLSQQVHELETHLKAQLLHRTTRQIRLTEIGQTYYTRCKAAFKDLMLADELATQETSSLQGVIRINSVGGILGEEVIAPIIIAFQMAHPDVQIHLDFSSTHVDLLGTQYDIVVRMGTLLDSSLIARTLRTVTTRFVASPSFFDKYPDAITPTKLRALPVIYGSISQWNFSTKGNKQMIDVSHHGLKLTNGRVMKQAALCGLGIARLMDLYVDADIQSGKLIEVLPEYAEQTPLSLISPPAQYQLKRVKTLIDWIHDKFNTHYESKLASSS